MALTCGPGLSAAEGATAVEAGSAAAARCWAKGAAAVAGPTPCRPREAGRGRREESNAAGPARRNGPAGQASGSGSWATRLLGPKTEKGKNINKTPFLFPKTYFQNQFQFKFQFSLKF